MILRVINVLFSRLNGHVRHETDPHLGQKHFGRRLEANHLGVTVAILGEKLKESVAFFVSQRFAHGLQDPAHLCLGHHSISIFVQLRERFDEVSLHLIVKAVGAEQAEQFVDAEASVRLVNPNLQLLDFILPNVVLEHL